jgi:soluble lytic murein transglycosylase-like protein
MVVRESIRRVAATAAPVAVAIALAVVPLAARAGAQAEEQLAPSVATLLSRAISDQPAPADYVDRPALRAWLDQMSPRLASRIADTRSREDFLATVHYEATRAGLDPQLVLGVIQHESAFRKYAVSIVGARGYMQVMPFWTKLIGSPEQNLFHLRTNLRYGCVILRHYLDIENGDVYRALGRYNGSLGQAEYPTAIMTALNRNWVYTPASPPGNRIGAVTLVPTSTR